MATSKQSRKWAFTLNNYTDEEYTAITRRFTAALEVDLRYAIVAREQGDEGTPHLQGYFASKKCLTFKKAKAVICDRAHLEAARKGDSENKEYCSKGGDYVEFGTPVGKGGRSDLDKLCRAIKDGKTMTEVAEISPADYVRNYKGLAAYQALQTTHYEHSDIRGIWIYGPPGTGKSHHARNLGATSLYIKSQNKWFDGYAGEEYILLDDLDSNILGHHLKIWADKWPCTGEIKGGNVILRHKYFIVTSNYAPAELWADEPVMCNAVSRRFEIIFMPTRRDTLRITECTREPIQTTLRSPALTRFSELKIP